MTLLVQNLGIRVQFGKMGAMSIFGEIGIFGS